jgi:lysozyme
MFSEQIVERYGKAENQQQFDALVSFVFNVGGSAFIGSTLLRRIKERAGEAAIREQFARWNKGGGVVLPGLVKRRQDEAELYFS